MYYITGRITYSTTNNRNSALAGINNVLSNYPAVTGVETSIASGINTEGNNVITISISVPDSEIEAFRLDLMAAWTAVARTNAYVGTFRV